MTPCAADNERGSFFSPWKRNPLPYPPAYTRNKTIHKKNNTIMEQLNRIELIGVVGRDAKIINVGDSAVANFSMATNYACKDKNGNAVVETTWHNVRAWKGSRMPPLEDIKKGTWLHLTGRIRNIRYTAADGSERTSYEVLAGEIEIVDPEKKG